MDIERLYTTSEVAEILRISEQTVRALVDRGALRATHVGRLLRFRRGDVEAYIYEQDGDAECS